MKKSRRIAVGLLAAAALTTTAVFSAVRVYDSDELTAEILETRTSSGIIIVERTAGVVLNEDGDGRCLDASDDFNYISYRGMSRIPSPGTLVTTYCLYDPFGNDVDDIVLRLDFPETGNH